MPEEPFTSTHTESNRLARRLFQLEQRVTELERQIDDITAMLEFLLEMQSVGESNDFGICFCTCDEDENLLTDY